MKTIKETIQDYCKNNGAYIHKNVLERLCIQGNRYSGAKFLQELSLLKNEGAIELEGDRIYLTQVLRQEDYVAERLRGILTTPTAIPSELPPVIHVHGITLTDDQRRAVQICSNKQMSMLLSPAGCGKTTTAEAIAHHVGVDNILFCAPTGIAAKHLTDKTGIEAVTVHRALGAKNDDDFLRVERLDGVNTILVDESSMLTIHMLGGILRAAPDDCRIILMGDPRQLPAVGAGNVVEDLISLGIPIANLSQNHRLSSNAFALRCNVLEYDRISDITGIEEDDSFQCRYSEDSDKLMNALVREAAERYLAYEPVQILTIRRNDALELSRRMQQIVNPLTSNKHKLETSRFVFADLDPVMIVKNDYGRGCFNGEKGVIHIEKDDAYCIKLDDGRCVEWSDLENREELVPAYAITIHKSQGSEFDTALMYVPWCGESILHRNTFYTGISRAKRQLLLFGNRGAVSSALHTLPPVRNTALVEKVRMCA